MLRICLVVRVLWPGGVQRIAFAEAEQLTRLGHQVELVFIRRTNRVVYECATPYTVFYDGTGERGIIANLLAIVTKRYAPERGRDATVDLDLLRMFEKTRKKYDILIYFDQHSAFFARYGQKKHGDRFIVQIFETAFAEDKFAGHHLLPMFVEKRALKFASAIITIAKEVQHILLSAGYRNVNLIYPGLYPRENVPKFDERENVAVSSTMWDFGRRPEVFLEVASHMNKGRIILAGSWADASYMEKFRAQIQERKLSNIISITGQIEDGELDKIYLKSKVAIRFGYGEKGPGMGTLEALSAGLPLIINSGIGAKELLIDGINCVVLDEADTRQIAYHLSRLFTEKQAWETMSAANIQLSKNLTWEEHAKRIDTILNSL